MKLPDLMKTFLIAAFLTSGICLFSQSAADYDARLNPIQSYQRNNPSYLYQKPASQSQTVEVARSDMGIQRPIEAKNRLWLPSRFLHQTLLFQQPRKCRFPFDRQPGKTAR